MEVVNDSLNAAIFERRDWTMCIRGGRTFNRHMVDPIKDADTNHVTINILHGMAWLGRINRPGPHRTSRLWGLPAACKTGNPLVPFSFKCCTHAERENNYFRGILRESKISRIVRTSFTPAKLLYNSRHVKIVNLSRKLCSPELQGSRDKLQHRQHTTRVHITP